MKFKLWLLSGVILLLMYSGIVVVLGFEGLGLGINFLRVAVAVAVLIIYVPALNTIFREVPPPNRDYLMAGVIMTWTSAVCFAVWNEAGRIFEVNTSIFMSPIAGFFSLLLVIGGMFHLRAAYPKSQAARNLAAVLIGVGFSALLVFVAPLFRPH